MNDTRPHDRLKDYEETRKDEIKDAMKEAIHEWLDEKFSQVGKWTVRGIAAAALSALVYFMIHFGGKP